MPEARGRAAKIIQDAQAYAADRRRGHRRGRALHPGLRRIQEGARSHAPAHVSRNHGGHSRRHGQDHHRYRPAAVGVVPYLPLPSCRAKPASATGGVGRQAMSRVSRRRRRRPAADRRRSMATAPVHVNQTKQALVMRFGEPRVVADPGLNVKTPFLDSVIYSTSASRLESRRRK